MLTKFQRYLLFTFMQSILNAGPIDSRMLIKITVQVLSPIMPNLNYHHAAGMLSALKQRSGRHFIIITPRKKTYVF